MARQRAAKTIGLAIVGAGRIGLIRGEIAARHANVGWIGIAETRADHGKDVARGIGADFVTTDHRELLARPEVTAAIIATDEHLHVDPILAAVERRLSSPGRCRSCGRDRSTASRSASWAPKAC